MDRHALQSLAEIFPGERLLTDPADLLCYSYDATQLMALPDAVVFPDGTAQVIGLMRWANHHGVPVVPRGAGTGFVGGSVPVAGGVVLSFERMNRILEIDRDNLVAVVEPGVVTADLHRAVQEVGLFYPPDPSSSASCTLGGNAACGATGPRSVKYGGTRDYVLGVEAVLPSGELIPCTSKAVKRVVGIDMARLLVGTEGTLGIITQLTLRLIPAPQSVRTLLVSFPEVTDAARAVSRVIASGLIPRACEFMDHHSLDLIRAHTRVAVADAAQALLIMETDGTEQAATAMAEAIEAVCREEHALEVRRADTEAETKSVWAARKALSQAMYEVAPTKINEDVVVPRSRLPELVAVVDALVAKYRLPIVCFGHAGEGNLHVNIMADRADAEVMARAKKAVVELFEAVVALDGSVSGEHGIGLAKAPYLPIEVGPAGMAAMGRVKAAFDPNGILNPGKIFGRKWMGNDA